MPDQASVSVVLSLSYWENYRWFARLMFRVSRRRLIIFVLAMLVLSALGHPLRGPAPAKHWYRDLMDDKVPLEWILGSLIVLTFVVPLLFAGKRAAVERIRGGDLYRFAHSGIHVENSTTSADYAWTTISKVRETPSDFLIYWSWSPNDAQLLPLRCFASTSDISTLRELFRAHVPPVQSRHS